MYQYLTINDLEDDMVWLFRQVERDIGTAGDDGILAMMHDVSTLAWYIGQVAAETDEWTCFAACEQHRNSLHAVYDSLNDRLMAY